MKLKEEFRSYGALPFEQDAQIVPIALESKLKIPTEQCSSLLYGDSEPKSRSPSSTVFNLQTHSISRSKILRAF